MIKIIITSAFLLGTTIIYAQQKETPRSSREQILSTENPHNPLVNGIPYDQYKAKVEADQKEKEMQEAKAKSQNLIDSKKLPVVRKSEDQNQTTEQKVK